MEPDPLLPEELPEAGSEEQILENIFEDTSRSNAEASQQRDALIETTGSTTEAVRDLEPILDVLVQNTAPKQVQKMELVPSSDPDDPEWNENQAGKALWSMLRGPKGHTPVKGEEYFTPEEITQIKSEVVEEVIPKVTPVKGKDYMTAEEMADLLDAATPKKGEHYFDGEKGDDGHTPTSEEITALIVPLIPEPKDGKTPTAKELTALIKPLIPAPVKPKVQDITPYIEKLKKELEEDMDSRVATFRKVSSRDYDLTELKDVTITNPTNGQVLRFNGTTLKWENGTGGAGSTEWGDITGTLSAQTDLQTALDAKADLAGDTFTGDIEVPDEAYGVGWNGSTEVPTKNAIYDKIQTLASGGITRTIVVTSGSATMGAVAAVDYVYLVAGAHTMTLPTAVANTNRYTVKNNHSAATTVDTTGAETIDGGASISLQPQSSVDIISDNTNWNII